MTWLISMIVAGLLSVGAGDISSDPPNAGLVNASGDVQIIATDSNLASNVQQNNEKQEQFDQTYPLSANGRISLSNINGAVNIEVWDRNEARVSYVKTIDCERPFQIDVKINSNASGLQIETEYPRNENTWVYRGSKDSKSWSNGYQNRCREAKVDYKLIVPRGAQLDEIETVNGGITVGEITNYAKISTVNGRIVANNLSGTVNLSSVNGTLDVGFNNLDNVREVKISMVNGKIDLQLPSDVDATVKAGTVNGTISNEFGLKVRKGEYVGRDMYARLGSGNIPIRLNGVNGTINVRRKQDGRQIKPATDLLPPKDKDFDDQDGDQDNDDAVRVRPPRPPRPPVVVPEADEYLDKATREEIRRATAESLKVARKINIDSDKIREQIRTSVEQSLNSAEVQRAMAMAQREFNMNLGLLRFPLSERETESVSVDANNPTISVEARGGSISIRGWDRAEVAYALVKQVDSGLNNKSSKKEVSLQKDRSNIKLNVASNVTNYRLEINVPKKSNLRVKTSRAIRVENVTGELQLDGADAGIDIRDSGGSLGVRTANGNVRVIGFEGDAAIKTLGGNIALEGDFSRLDTDTADGITVLTLPNNISAALTISTEIMVFKGIEPKNKTDNGSNLSVWQIGDEKTTKSFKLQSDSGKQIIVQSEQNIRVS